MSYTTTTTIGDQRDDDERDEEGDEGGDKGADEAREEGRDEGGSSSTTSIEEGDTRGLRGHGGIQGTREETKAGMIQPKRPPRLRAILRTLSLRRVVELYFPSRPRKRVICETSANDNTRDHFERSLCEQGP